MSSGAITVRVDALELARGNDGLLRGHPEPVLLVGLFSRGPHGARLRARHLIRFGTPADIPATLTPRATVRLTAMLEDDDVGFIVLALALEDDGGTDVARLYGALERPERLAAWMDGESIPNPVALDRVCVTRPRLATPIQLLADGTSLEHLHVDDWIGACVVDVPGGLRWISDVRMSFLSADHENDWTARMRVNARVPLNASLPH